VRRIDATEIPYVTLDPPTSTDLDQAFFLSRDGNEIVLSYALADLTRFVPEGGPVEAEAWQRGVTIYGVNKVPLYPTAISQRAASLLPDGPRPAVQVTVGINSQGDLRLRSVQRIVCASRAKLDYPSVDVRSIPYLEPFAQRMSLNESQRGSVRFEFPHQEVVADETAPGGIRLELKSPLPSEIINSCLSLAVNMVLGELLMKAHVGLFRVMDEPASRAMERLRREAHALSIPWAADETIKDVQRRLDPTNVVHQRFLMIVRRAGGRAGYAVYSPEKRPWHAAIGATYVHATAPMRRLADRYVLDLACLLAQNESVPDSLLAKLQALPAVMSAGEGKARNVERAVIDLIEVVSLQDRIGEVLEAEVVDAELGIVQTYDSAIRSRAAQLGDVANGDKVRVRIDKADLATRQVVLTAV
jgi:exoribonuclease R